MFQTIIQKIVFAITIVLCLGLISCGETNKPIDPIDDVINIGNIGDDDITNIDNPTATDDGQIFIGTNLYYDIYDANTGAYGGALMHRASIASDLIVVTEVYKVENSKAYLTITETLRGSTTDTEIKVQTNRFSKNEKYIFFLRKDGDRYVLLTYNTGDHYTPSIVSLSLPWAEFWPDDIKLIISAYNDNRELFSNKQALFQLYPKLKNWHMRLEVLLDMRWNVGFDKQDLPVLIEWQQRETEGDVMYTVLQTIIKNLQGEEE
jgi:hypothetical protein